MLSNIPDTKRACQWLNDVLDQLSKTSRLQLESEKLKKELLALKQEVQEGFKNKILIVELEKKIELMQQSQDEKIKVRIQEVQTQHSKALKELELKCEGLSKSLSASKETIQRMKDQLNESNNYIAQAEKKYIEDLKAKESEIDFLNNEVDNLSNKVMTLEKMQQNDNTETVDKGDLEYEVSQKEWRIGELQNTILNLESKSTLMSDQMKRDKELYHQEVIDLRKENNSLRKSIQELPSIEAFEKMKHHLNLLVGLNYYFGSEDADLDLKDQNVDSIIRDQLRRLERDNIDMRAKLHEFNDVQKSYETQLKLREEEMEAKDQMIRQLEENIEDKIQTVDESSIEPSASNEDEKLVKVLIGQRDRLKLQCQQLELEKQDVLEKLQEVSSQASLLSNENVQLYKRIKYLQSYPSRSSSQDVTIDLREGGDVEDKYKDLYDTNMNPFVDFTNKEKTRKYKELNPVEKLIYNFASFFMANKQTRMFLFFYTLSLHFLVFIITYKMATSPSYQKE